MMRVSAAGLLPSALLAGVVLGCAHPAPHVLLPVAETGTYTLHDPTAPPPRARYAEVTDPANVVELVGSKAKLVARALREARARGDSKGARCLDQSLSQIHAQERRAQEQASALQDATRRQDNQAARQHRVILGIVLEDADELEERAGRCDGSQPPDRSEGVVVDVADPPAAQHAGL